MWPGPCVHPIKVKELFEALAWPPRTPWGGGGRWLNHFRLLILCGRQEDSCLGAYNDHLRREMRSSQSYGASDMLLVCSVRNWHNSCSDELTAEMEKQWKSR